MALNNAGLPTAQNLVSKRHEIIVIPVSAFAEVMTEIRNHKKIAAIKALRRTYHERWPTRDKLGLREAKHAVERIADELADRQVVGDSRPVLRTSLSISGIMINTGNEKVEVDLEELQLRILSEVSILGLAECGRILEIVEVFQAWSSGKRVGVIEDS